MRRSELTFGLLPQLTAIGCVIQFLFAAALDADDWPCWRGPEYSGVVREASGWNGVVWLNDASAWSVECGSGATSPIVVQNRVYVMGWSDGEDHLRAFDLESGREIWRSSYAAPARGRHATGDESFYSGTSATPTFDPTTQQLFTLSIDGDLKAWSAAEGTEIWSLNLYDEYQVPQRPRVGRAALRDYGYTTSPCVIGDTVIVEVGSEQGNLMAFSTADGELIWQSENKDPAGHTGGIVPTEIEGVPCVAVLTLMGLHVTRIDPEHSGETVAEYPWITDFANNIPTVVVVGDSVLLTTKYNQNAISRLKISLSEVKEVWTQPVASGVCTPIVNQQRVFWASHQLFCLDFETGETVWQGGRYGDAGSCILTIDQKLVVWGASGSLGLIDADPELREVRELSRREFHSPSDAWPHVALSQGRVLIKTREGTLTCLVCLESEP